MKLLSEYKGQKITIKAVVGYVTFDTNNVDEDEYPAYHALGFDFCFEPIEPKYKAPIKYVGIEQVQNLIKPNKKKNAKKVKTETEKE